jgi:hypothetical protein
MATKAVRFQKRFDLLLEINGVGGAQRRNHESQETRCDQSEVSMY